MRCPLILPLTATLFASVTAQLKTELGPAVSTHCTNIILRVWNFSDADWERVSDQQLEDLNDELDDKCRPTQGWTIEDGFYHHAAVGGVLKRRLIRSMDSDTQHMRELTALLKENQLLRDQLKKKCGPQR
jgi:hypothetical protein